MVKSTAKNNLTGHLAEFRKRFIISLVFFLIFLIVGYVFSQNIYQFLLLPLEDSSGIARRIIYTSPIEAFFSYLRISFIFAFFASFPFIISQIYLFLAPGLYKKERKIMTIIFVISPILFFLGMAICYYIILPLALKFFLSFENIANNIPIILEAKISEYLKLIINMIMIFGVIFQIPLFFLLLIEFGKISKKSLKKFRKYYIIIAFIFGAIFTPPDIISQISVAIIMVIFYELTIILCRK